MPSTIAEPAALVLDNPAIFVHVAGPIGEGLRAVGQTPLQVAVGPRECFQFEVERGQMFARLSVFMIEPVPFAAELLPLCVRAHRFILHPGGQPQTLEMVTLIGIDLSLQSRDLGGHWQGCGRRLIHLISLPVTLLVRGFESGQCGIAGRSNIVQPTCFARGPGQRARLAISLST